MTIYTSNMISSMIGAGNAGMFNNAAYAQQMSMGMGMPGMTPGAMGPMSFFSAMGRGQGGMYGERFAAGMGSMGVGAMGFGRMGVELGAGMLGGSMGTAMGAAMGYGAMGAGAMGMAGSLGMTMPVMAAGGVARAYGGAFMGGMEDQAGLNSSLRNNFNFFGGNGPMGRGFNQSQMGQIGGMISGELRRNPFSNAQEMNQLVAGGAESGMLTGVRDVQQFTQGFRRMLDTLRSVQRELGGTLTEALSFVRNSQQAGIFQNADRVNFASEVRNAEAVTGMDRTQLTALAATGASISRNFGGTGRSGAYGALRGAQTLGAAMSSGAINAEMMSEATGGLTGAEAITAFTTRMMEHTGRFSRTGMGRFSLFALSNREGTGLDADMVERFRSGDISVGDVSRRAHANVGTMGRARALNREGALRGELMEEGGMAAQIGMMRLMMGDRVMDRGDDFASLVMQRRFGMSRPESEMMTSLMRNQGTIADREMFDRMSSRREADFNTDSRENRSVDAFMTHLEHGVNDATGLTRAREMGRGFLSRISAVAERAMNAIVGTASSSLSEGDRAAINRMSIGRGTAADVELLSMGASAGGGTITAASLFNRSAGGSLLGAMGMHGMDSIGERLERRGVRGLHGADAGDVARTAIEDARLARSGVVSGASADALARMEEDADRTTRRLTRARLIAAGGGNEDDAYRVMGADANALDAFMSRRGMAGIGPGIGRGALTGLGGMSAGDILSRLGGGALAGAGVNGAGGALAGLAGAFMSLGEEPGADAASFIASGGHRAASMRERGAGSPGMMDRLLLAGLAGPAALLADGRSAELRGMEGVTSDTVRAVTDNDSFRRRISRMSSRSGDREGVEMEIRSLEEAAHANENAEERTAMLSMVEQMRHNLSANGDIGEEFRNLGMSPEREAEIRESLLDSRFNARRMAEAIGDRNTGLSSRLMGASESFGSAASGGGSEALNAANDSMAGVLDDLSRMDPDSAEYRELAESLGDVEGGSELLSSASSRRRTVRDLSGGGRLGRRGSDETALSMLTGGRFGEMNIELNRGGRTRRVSSAMDIMRLIRRGGADATSITNQLTEELTNMGVGNASELVGAVTSASEGGFSDSEARELTTRFDREMSSGELGESSRRANEETLRRNNPLDATRNDLLTRIAESTGRMAEVAGSGMPMGSAEGG